MEINKITNRHVAKLLDKLDEADKLNESERQESIRSAVVKQMHFLKQDIASKSKEAENDEINYNR